MASITVLCSRFGIWTATVHLVHSSIICSIVSFLWKSRSTCTVSLKRVDSLELVIDLGPGRVQVLQIQQVSTMSSMSGSTADGAPACCSNSFVRFAGACHHRKCSFRRQRRTTPSRTDRNSCSMEPRSNSLQDLPSRSETDSSLPEAAGTMAPADA